MSELKVDTIVNLAGTGKPNLPVSPTLEGAALSSANTYAYTASASEPSSPKNGHLWWDSANSKVKLYINGEFKEVTLNATVSNPFTGDRGFVGTGGDVNQIEYFDITTTANASDFGDYQSSSAINHQTSVSNATNIVFAEQSTNSGSQNTYNALSTITCATTGNASDFGDAVNYWYGGSAASNGTTGLFAGGYGRPGSNPSASADILYLMEYITIATTGNATDWGATIANSAFEQSASGVSGANKAIFAGGFNTSYAAINNIEQVAWTTGSSSTDFGDLLAASINLAGTQSETRAVWGGGAPSNSVSSGVNTIQYVTIDTAGNATDFGDLTVARTRLSACSNLTRGVFSGGYNNSSAKVNTMDYITIATTGNATDFGDLTTTKDKSFSDSGAAS